MQWLSDWVYDLVVIVFFVSVAYMLLPENNLRPYARLVMGLVVIAALLTPIFDIMQWEPGALSMWEGVERTSTEQLIAHGRYVAVEAQDRLTEDGRQRSVDHVASVVELVLGVVPRDVDVRWAADGSIEGITVTVEGAVGSGEAERAARLIAGLLGVGQNQVHLRWTAIDGQGGAMR